MPQANEILDQQINDIERLTEEISTTGKKVDLAREEVSRTAKEVSESADARAIALAVAIVVDLVDLVGIARWTSRDKPC